MTQVEQTAVIIGKAIRGAAMWLHYHGVSTPLTRSIFARRAKRRQEELDTERFFGCQLSGAPKGLNAIIF